MIFTDDFFTPQNNYAADDLVTLIDSRTEENVNFKKVSVWHDGSSLNGNIDGIIYREKDPGVYYADVSYLEGKSISMNRFPNFSQALETCRKLNFILEIHKTVNLNNQSVDLQGISLYFGVKGQMINGTVILSDNYISGYENHFLCNIEGAHNNLPIEFFGVSSNNGSQENSDNIARIRSRKIQFNFSAETYNFARHISYNGNDYIGVSNTLLNFPDSGGIYLEKDFLKDTSLGSDQERLQYVSWKKFKGFKIKSKYECFNFYAMNDPLHPDYPVDPDNIVYKENAAQSFNYCQFHDLDLHSETSCFYSNRVPNNNDSFCYANDFKNIIASAKVSIFENIPLTVVTSIDNLHDVGTPVIFKNCLSMNLLCQNFNIGYSLNVKHIIYNTSIRSNYQRIKFTNCNFEQIISTAVVNLNMNAMFNLSFENCYLHYGTHDKQTQIEGKEIYSYNKVSRNIEKKVYVITDDFYPMVGYNLSVRYINSIYDPISNVPNKNDLLMTVTVNNENILTEIPYCDLDQYNLVRAYRVSGDIAHYPSEKKTQRVFNIENDWSSYVAYDSKQKFSGLLVNSLHLNKTIVTFYNGESIEGSNIIFSSDQNIIVEFDKINKNMYGFCYLTHKGSGNVSISTDNNTQLVLDRGTVYRYSYIFRVFEPITNSF